MADSNPPTSPASPKSPSVPSTVPSEGFQSQTSIKADIEAMAKADSPASATAAVAPSSPAAPKPLNVHCRDQLLAGHFRGGCIDVLLQELVDQGYRRPSYDEVAYVFGLLGLTLFADRVQNEEERPAVIRAIERAQFGPEAMLEDEDDDSEAGLKPFDRDALIFLVERHRGGLLVEWILDELDDMGYEMPGWDVVHDILEANGMSREDGNVVGPNGFVAYEGRVWGEIVIPDGIFDDEA